MQHGDIWRGIDLLARKHGLTPSGLARRAGLDATAFNKSKRLPKDGRPRWPSTESLARVLAAVGSDFDEFAALVSGRRSVSLPLVAEEALNHTDAAQHLENADVTSKHIRLPSNGASDTCFIVELTSDAFAPAYQIGDRLIVAPPSEFLEAGLRPVLFDPPEIEDKRADVIVVERKGRIERLEAVPSH